MQEKNFSNVRNKIHKSFLSEYHKEIHPLTVCAREAPHSPNSPPSIIKLPLIFFSFPNFNNSIPFVFLRRGYFVTHISKTDKILLFSNIPEGPELKIPNSQMGSFPKVYFKVSNLQSENISL